MRVNRDLDAAAREWAALRPAALAALAERHLHIGGGGSNTAAAAGAARAAPLTSAPVVPALALAYASHPLTSKFPLHATPARSQAGL